MAIFVNTKVLLNVILECTKKLTKQIEFSCRKNWGKNCESEIVRGQTEVGYLVCHFTQERRNNINHENSVSSVHFLRI